MSRNYNIFFIKILLTILLIVCGLPINKVDAYSGGYISGKPFKIGSTTSLTYNITDNDESTSETLGLSGSANDKVSYTLDTETYLKSFRINISGDARIIFEDSNSATIEFFNTNSKDGSQEILLTSTNRYKVKTITIVNNSKVLSPTIKEFDVFLEPMSMGIMREKQVKGYNGDGTTLHTQSISALNDGQTSTRINPSGLGSSTILTYFEYTFDSPTDLKRFDVLTSNKQINIELYDASNNLITTKYGTNTWNHQNILLDTNGVKKIRFFAPSSGGYLLFEAELYGKTPPPTTTSTVNFGIFGSTHQISSPSGLNFGTISLSSNGGKTSTPIGTIEAGDLTGEGKGWRLQVQATPMTNGESSFPMNSLILNTPTNIAPANSDIISPVPTISSGFPWAIDSGNAITVVKANENEGMGSYLIDFSSNNALTLNIPLSAKTGNYSTTITWKVVVGP